MAFITKHHIEFYFSDGTTSTQEVSTRDVNQVQWPDGAEKARFFDKKLIDVPHYLLTGPYWSDPSDYSDYFTKED